MCIDYFVFFERKDGSRSFGVPHYARETAEKEFFNLLKDRDQFSQISLYKTNDYTNRTQQNTKLLQTFRNFEDE